MKYKGDKQLTFTSITLLTNKNKHLYGDFGESREKRIYMIFILIKNIQHAILMVRFTKMR